MQVGNAVTDNYYDSIGTVAFWWSHSMISDRSYRSIMDHCDFIAERTSEKCDEAVSYAVNHEFGDIDQYSIYTPSCMALPNSSTIRSPRFKNSLVRRRVSGYDPCTENYAEKYYNRPDVQKAMHANSTGIPYKWTACRLFSQFNLIFLNLSYTRDLSRYGVFIKEGLVIFLCWAVVFL